MALSSAADLMETLQDQAQKLQDLLSEVVVNLEEVTVAIEEVPTVIGNLTITTQSPLPISTINPPIPAGDELFAIDGDRHRDFDIWYDGRHEICGSDIIEDQTRMSESANLIASIPDQYLHNPNVVSSSDRARLQKWIDSISYQLGRARKRLDDLHHIEDACVQISAHRKNHGRTADHVTIHQPVAFREETEIELALIRGHEAHLERLLKLQKNAMETYNDAFIMASDARSSGRDYLDDRKTIRELSQAMVTGKDLEVLADAEKKITEVIEGSERRKMQVPSQPDHPEFAARVRSHIEDPLQLSNPCLGEGDEADCTILLLMEDSLISKAKDILRLWKEFDVNSFVVYPDP